MDWNRSHGLESFSWTGIVLMEWNRSHELESFSCTGIVLVTWNRSHGMEPCSWDLELFPCVSDIGHVELWISGSFGVVQAASLWHFAMGDAALVPFVPAIPCDGTEILNEETALFNLISGPNSSVPQKASAFVIDTSIPVVLHRAVAEVSEKETYTRAWLL